MNQTLEEDICSIRYIAPCQPTQNFSEEISKDEVQTITSKPLKV